MFLFSHTTMVHTDLHGIVFFFYSLIFFSSLCKSTDKFIYYVLFFFEVYKTLISNGLIYSGGGEGLVSIDIVFFLWFCLV